MTNRVDFSRRQFRALQRSRGRPRCRRSGAGTACFFESLFAGATDFVLSADYALRSTNALVAGLLVGAVSSLLGVAGGELIIPILIFLFGADIKTAVTAGLLISTPIVLVRIARAWLTGHYRSPPCLVIWCHR